MKAWLVFALLTVACWGVYGVFLHKGALGMGDPVNGRFKAFLIVGVAYYLVAIVGSLFLLLSRGATFSMPPGGFWWSLVAGVAGALGALFVLLAFGAKGSPAVVMSIIFAGAPVVNAFVAIATHPPDGGWGAVRPQFWLGIALAALGGCLVTLFKPAPGSSGPGHGAPSAAPASAAAPAPAPGAAGPERGA
jgi:hypothetical protein